jgi:hypothetical protein
LYRYATFAMGMEQDLALEVVAHALADQTIVPLRDENNYWWGCTSGGGFYYKKFLLAVY